MHTSVVDVMEILISQYELDWAASTCHAELVKITQSSRSTLHLRLIYRVSAARVQTGGYREREDQDVVFSSLAQILI